MHSQIAQKHDSACSRRIKLGASEPEAITYTQQVLNAIRDGHNTLHAIAAHTQIKYRSVNAMVASLEKQKRVEANSYDLKRELQVFDMVGAVPRPAPRPPQVCRLFEALGMGRLPVQETSCQIRVYRQW